MPNSTQSIERNKCIMEYENQIIPEVGMGATELLWSDRYPYTVIKVLGKTRIIVQEDIYTMLPNGNYEFKPNPKGEKKTLVKTTKGWKVHGGKTYFRLNTRAVYIDPSF